MNRTHSNLGRGTGFQPVSETPCYGTPCFPEHFENPNTQHGLEARATTLFKADWLNALFIHFRVDPATLQAWVPLELDVWEGHAYISLVAFTQANLRPSLGGKLAAWLSGPISTHHFLNVRTYVRRGPERGIYFLAEWIPNRLAVGIGPRLYGLPYRWGRLNYGTTVDGTMTREVICPSGSLECDADILPGTHFECARPGTEAEFLLERYTAFTYRSNLLRRFRIRHEPWLQAEVNARVGRCDLFRGLSGAVPSLAHFSTGVRDVAIGKPERLERRLGTWSLK